MTTSEEESNATSAPIDPAVSTPGAGTTALSPGQLTPGQRLAAARAAKAARKASKRGKDAEVVEDKALEHAARASDWYEKRKKTLWTVLGGVLLISLGVIVLSNIRQSQAEKDAQALWLAVKTSGARVVESTSTETSSDEETFSSIGERSETALESFQSASELSSQVSAWAHLGKGRSLLELGKPKDAYQSFKRVLSEADDPVIRLRAYEGAVSALESQGDWKTAEKELTNWKGSLRDAKEPTASRLTSSYWQARIALGQHQKDKALPLLEQVSKDLKSEGAPNLPHIEQATQRLIGKLDPKSAVTPASPSAGPGSNLSPEQLQELIRQFKQQGGNGLGGK